MKSSSPVDLATNPDQGTGAVSEMERAEHFRRLERMFELAPINALLGPSITVSDGTALLRLPVRQDFFHAAGAVHGSLYVKALDDAAWFACASRVDDVFLLTQTLTTHFARPITKGTVIATGRVVDVRRLIILADAELRDTEGRLLGRASGVFMRGMTALSSIPAYADPLPPTESEFQDIDS